jgi:cobalt-precorrin-5B (C1)-methyltransferase
LGTIFFYVFYNLFVRDVFLYTISQVVRGGGFLEYKNGLEDYYKLKDNKKLRYGYTTGSCAAAAANAAINKVPRKMITDAVLEVCDENDYFGGIHVEIIIPKGEEIAQRTFNPNLGIVGGISILGTSGIVEPMSETAIIDSIRVEMKMAAVGKAEYLLLSPGNYGIDFTKKNMALPKVHVIKFSNYVGEAIDIAIELGVKGILFISHIGKFIKVAGGIMNTHSKYADARMEIMAANAVLAGASIHTVQEVLKCVTTDEAIAILKSSKVMEKTMEHVMEKIQYYLNRRACEAIEIGAIIFSNQYGILGQTENAKELLQCLENCTE